MSAYIPTAEERAAHAVAAGLPPHAGWDEIWLRCKILELRLRPEATRDEVDTELRRRELIKVHGLAEGATWDEIDALQREKLCRLLDMSPASSWTRLVDALNDSLGCSYCCQEEPIVGWRDPKKAGT